MGKRQDTRDRIERRIVELGRATCHRRGRGPVATCDRTRTGHGVVGGLPVRRQPRRPADPAARRCLHRSRRHRRAGPRRGRRGDGAHQLAAMARAAREWAVRAAGRSGRCSTAARSPATTRPADETVGPGTRVVGALFAVVATGVAAGESRLQVIAVPQPLSTDFDGLRAEFGFAGDDAVWPSASCCGRRWSARSASRCSASTGRHVHRPAPVRHPGGPADRMPAHAELEHVLASAAPLAIFSWRCLTRHLSRLRG